MQQRLGEEVCELVRRRHLLLSDARLAVDAHPHGHPPEGHLEQPAVGTRQRAAAERDAQRPASFVGAGSDPCDIVQRATLVRGRTRDLEHHKIACDASPPVNLVGGGAADVIGDDHGAARNPLGLEAPLSLVEVEDVSGVVAIAQEHAGAGLRCDSHAMHLIGRWRREDVTDDSTVGQSAPDQPAERGIVAGASADDHGHGRLARRVTAHNAARDGAHPAAVGGDEPFNHLVNERGGIVEKQGHSILPECRLLV